MQAIVTQLIFDHALRIRVKNAPGVEKGADGQTKKQKKANSSSLEGRLNNLIGSDLNAVVGGRDIVVYLVYGPMQVILCFSFLFTILGWR